MERRPPDLRTFLSQRVRQAYDDFAQPARAGIELSLLPLVVWALRRPRRLGIVIAVIWLLAATGREGAGGRTVFPALAVLWAPAWVAERAACIWVAAGSRIFGGARYRGRRLRDAASTTRALRRKMLKGDIEDLTGGK